MRVLIWQEKNPDIQGGAESWISYLAQGLTGRGHAVAWLHSEQIARGVEQFEADAVIVGTIHNFIGLPFANALAQMKLPKLWMLHDYWPFCTPRMLMQHQNRSDQPCEAAAETCRDSCGGKRFVPEVLAEFYVVTGCEGAADIMRRHEVRIDAVIEEGVDTDLFTPADKTANGVFASAAWEAPWKGMHVLKEAVGNEYRLLTGLARPNLAETLGHAKLYAFPSLYQEIWGLALTEAMASGCACVASDVAGARAQLHQDRRLGILVPPHDAAALRDAMQWLRDNPDEAAAMGQRAREHVAKDHSLDAMARRWEAAIEAAKR
jgi:hypothetical protein